MADEDDDEEESSQRTLVVTSTVYDSNEAQFPVDLTSRDHSVHPPPSARPNLRPFKRTR